MRGGSPNADIYAAPLSNERRVSSMFESLDDFFGDTRAALECTAYGRRFFLIRRFTRKEQSIFQRCGQRPPCVTSPYADVAVRAQRKRVGLPVVQVSAFQLELDSA